MLSASNVSYQIEKTVLLNDVSVQFGSGKINLIIGPNGAGKSTLIKILAGNLSGYHGQVKYDQMDLRKCTLEQLARFRAVLSQNIDLGFPLTVREVVMMGRYPHFNRRPQSIDHQTCFEVMAFFEVDMLAERNFMTLSGGERQRVHFARVAAQIWHPVNDQSRILILDEPLTFLDIYYQYDLMQKLLQLVKQPNVVVVGVIHDLNLVSRFADHVVLMDCGKIVASGTTEKVLTSENLKSVFKIDAVVQSLNGKTNIWVA
ncbi:MAG TPA: heme ABC transporter ATP-binding protein [Chryseosolibacter sp.]|nr:heme ABC transporter ATP-binding protein [Chryseosolibacter sp.]